MEYAETRGMLRVRRWKLAVLFVIYAACLHLAVQRIPLLYQDPHFDFLVPGRSLGQGFAIVLGVALAWSAGWEGRFAASAPDKPQRYFHWTLLAFSSCRLWQSPRCIFHRSLLKRERQKRWPRLFRFCPSYRFTVLIYLVQRHNFLQIGRQKNLLYAISATFLALLYLSLVRRLGTWLEPVLPPEATAAILLFILVIFIEPLQRALGRRLQETALKEMELAHRLSAEINQEARRGDVHELASFIESRLKEQFELADVGLLLWDPLTGKEERVPPARRSNRDSRSCRGTGPSGRLGRTAWGGDIRRDESGAGVLVRSIAGALDLCRLIEEKLRLERELAERERLALVGQMAASISHNLKNPLGSMKTILQVQLENRNCRNRFAEKQKWCWKKSAGFQRS